MLEGTGHSCLVTLLVKWQQLLRNCCFLKQEKKSSSQEEQRDLVPCSKKADLSKKRKEKVCAFKYWHNALFHLFVTE
jgi:hypothetical protein